MGSFVRVIKKEDPYKDHVGIITKVSIDKEGTRQIQVNFFDGVDELPEFDQSELRVV